VAGVVLVLACAAVAVADEPLAPQPTPEHKALGSWVGSWSGQGEMKPGPFGSGGSMQWTEECSWFEGGEFHVVCRSDGTSFMGPTRGLGIIGYNPGKGVYTRYGAGNNGWSGYSEGTRTGDTWTFRSEETMGGKTYHTRFTMTLVNPKRMDFAWEMSEGGSNGVVLMDGATVR
jgi:hypothetical protein